MNDLSADIRLIPNFGKVTCERTWKWDTHQHPLEEFDIWYVWSGEGMMTLHGCEFALSKGSCFLFRAGDRTFAAQNPKNPLTVTFLHFSLREEKHAELPGPYRVIRDTFLFETLLNRFVESRIAGGPDSDTEARLLAALMLLQLLREERFEPASQTEPGLQLASVIQDVAHLIRQNPGRPHTIESLAESARLSPRYFSLKFRQVMGITLETYLIRTKMERAEHLLRYSGMNVSEVAEALGFKDLSFFSRQFKQTRGKKPSAVKAGTE